MSDAYITELEQIKYRCLSILPFSSLLCLLSLVSYLVFRIRCIWVTFTVGIDRLTCLNTCLYLLSEIGFLFPGFLSHLLRCLAFQGCSRARHLRLRDGKAPRVDVFITCAGEDHDTVYNTVQAACASDYPLERFRVIVLDDGGSPDLSVSVKKLSESRRNLHYSARVKGKDHHFKAGNLNYGLELVKSLPGDAADYVAALDADMIPDPDWLRALVPHLLENPKLALVQPPQRFYDVPSGDPLMQGLDVNFKIIEPLKESMSSTWCGGSGYVVRRSALDSIGGFPTESVGEDMYCSNVLLAKGWQMAYVDETLQHGRVPDSYKAHIKQQGRWHVGRIQTAIAMGWYMYGSKSRGMSARQRLTGLIYSLLSISNIFTTISVLIMPFVFYSGLPLVVYARKDDLRILVRLVCTFAVCEWLDDCIVGLITGYRIAVSEGHATLWISPYHTVALISAFLPNWLKRKPFEFTASGAGTDSSQERDAAKRPTLLERLRTILWANKIGFHLVVILVLVVCLARASNEVLQRQHENAGVFFMDLLTCVAWPPLLWLTCLNSFFIPLQYAFSPPTIPNHDQLLKRDPVRRASYPAEVHETGHCRYVGSQEIAYSLIIVYTAALFGVSWCI